ncbi:catechol 2,3-dioxygenase-like lactoylglutathione lyase family enzyme [Nocardioides cavernae]|uniref:Bleomycin resistance protein n=1 Tax=Nocardioides cavernae TaxID=1921566 RepID=A0A7Y9H397_9ACTN|nr:bleomycin resistance protein [Nocardioides cavernae]NYE36399.1 catechol 2,3-dioxygenase-like lactoylglutathione lyase family enzyme [Nocardioides cavernae]
MVDHATPNLPSRDLDATVAFYDALGFEVGFHDPGWLVLQRGTLVLEFFPDPGMDPASSAASCCLRVDDLDGLYAVCAGAGIEETHLGWPRRHPPQVEDSGMRIAYVVDLDGNLLRLVQNPELED